MSAPKEAPPHVELDATGLPIAMRLFERGDNSLSLDDADAVLTVDDAFIALVLGWQEKNGARVPVDSAHYLTQLAEALKIDETELAETLKGARPAMAWGDLAERPDGLWLENLDWEPPAAALVRAKALRFPSPVVRGLHNNRPRITAVAMLNRPRTDKLLPLVAGDDDPTLTSVRYLAHADVQRAVAPNKQQERSMDPALIAALAALTSQDSIALGEDGALPTTLAAQVAEAAEEIKTLRLLEAGVRDALALGEDARAGAVEGRIRQLVEAEREKQTLAEKVDRLVLGEETRKKAELINQGKAEGKITPAMLEWAEKQDSVALGEFLKFAPVVVKPGRQTSPETLRDKPAEALALGEEERAWYRDRGLTEAEINNIAERRKAKAQ